MQAEIYQAPWREVLPTGQMSPYYGPRSPAALARAAKRWKNWAYRMPSKTARKDADRVIAFMRLEDGSLRQDVPESERNIYLRIYEQGRSVRWTAKALEVSRRTVRSYQQRLLARVDEALDKSALDESH